MTTPLLLAAVLPFPPFWWVLAIPATVFATWIAVLVLVVRLARLAGSRDPRPGAPPRWRPDGAHRWGSDAGTGWPADSGWGTDCGAGFDSSSSTGADSGSSC
ncbi:hypothetical protein NBH00_06410 [Paraconexibacter antarcticus]|uniref:Uncharacterized protein n=1 Tax=Paraconexibacter antarcticus TaxID=2949664 RepID=A0ABY5DWH9_9ACTN|nr:hypothetical protein [Paraconexibacter antarcticus]UTI65845.1 hypothetical protein NBH00_06410 [Paraconexibacter antarcticus]